MATSGFVSKQVNKCSYSTQKPWLKSRAKGGVKTVDTNTEMNRKQRENEELQESKDAFEPPQSDRQISVLGHTPGDKMTRVCSLTSLVMGMATAPSVLHRKKQLPKPNIPKPNQDSH